MHPDEQQRLLTALASLTRAAGDVIMDIYHSDFAVRGKDDASPVTDADERAEALILAGLAELEVDFPVVAEEATAAGNVPEVADYFWLVDPLDGTREFINRNGEFTVNIALIERGSPLLGVVYAPAINALYAGSRAGGAYVEDTEGRRPIQVREPASDGLDVLASRSHGDDAALKQLLAERPIRSLINAGSSLKLCLLAAGQADIYPRQGRTMEWDIAAGHAVLAAAGGQIQTLDGGPLLYGKPAFENPHFVASGAQPFFL